MSFKVLLVNPLQIKPVIGPIAFDYLGKVLKEKGYDVDLLDMSFIDDYKIGIDEYFQNNSPEAICITIRNIDDCYLASQEFFIPKIKKVIDYFKEKSKAPIILGGVGFSVMPKRILQYCQVDLGIKGEGELALPMLLDKIKNEEEFYDVPGLVYRSDEGFKINREEFVDLSRLSFAKREIIDNVRYLKEGGQGNIETKRGCDKKCIYCLDPISKGGRYRLRPPKDVADELENLWRLGVDYFHMCDSEFNLPEGQARVICEELINRKLGEKIHWYTYASPVPFSNDLAYLMRKAGCLGIDFGADSANDEMLRRLGRDFTKEDLKETARICHKNQIIFMYDLLLGGPGETKETIRETIELMKQISPSRVGLSIGMRIYPGTAISRIVTEQGVVKENPNLFGKIEGNEDFFEPIFYISSEIGEDIMDYVARLVKGDKRFFFASPEDMEQNYNYNQNLQLVEAIQKGYRGAYWDILRRLSEERI